MGRLGQGGGFSDTPDDASTITTEPTKPYLPDESAGSQTPMERALTLNRNLEGIVDVLIDRKSRWDEAFNLTGGD